MAKSSSSSTVAKVWGRGVRVVSSDDEGTWASEALFSTLGVLAVRAIFRGWNECRSTKYCWIDDLPAQMPGFKVSFVGICLSGRGFSHRHRFRLTFLTGMYVSVLGGFFNERFLYFPILYKLAPL